MVVDEHEVATNQTGEGNGRKNRHRSGVAGQHQQDRKGLGGHSAFDQACGELEIGAVDFVGQLENRSGEFERSIGRVERPSKGLERIVRALEEIAVSIQK